MILKHTRTHESGRPASRALTVLRQQPSSSRGPGCRSDPGPNGKRSAADCGRSCRCGGPWLGHRGKRCAPARCHSFGRSLAGHLLERPPDRHPRRKKAQRTQQSRQRRNTVAWEQPLGCGCRHLVRCRKPGQRNHRSNLNRASGAGHRHGSENCEHFQCSERERQLPGISALRHLRTLGRKRDVRFTPDSGHPPAGSGCLPSVNTRPSITPVSIAKLARAFASI
jgi:hypothetical protein